MPLNKLLSGNISIQYVIFSVEVSSVGEEYRMHHQSSVTQPISLLHMHYYGIVLSNHLDTGLEMLTESNVALLLSKSVFDMMFEGAVELDKNTILVSTNKTISTNKTKMLVLSNLGILPSK